MVPKHLRRYAATLGCAMLLTAPSIDAANAEGEDEDNPVVAAVNGKEIRYQEVIEAAQDLPMQYRQQLDAIFPMLIDRMVDMELVAQAAEAEGLADHEEVERRLEEMRTGFMRDVYLERKIDEYMTDERLREAYEQYAEEHEPQEEIQASHILVDEREKAEDLIAQLDDGADFAELAREHSTGPSAEAGGDLGYFGRGAMVGPFEDAAFALEEGEYTREPVETQFGWHVIQKSGERTSEPRSFEEMEDELRASMQRDAIEATLEELRAEAEVETFPARHDPATSDGDTSAQPTPDAE